MQQHDYFVCKNVYLVTKIFKKNLNIIAFKNFLKHTLTTLNVIYEMKSKQIEFNQRWENILNYLNQDGEPDPEQT